MDLEHISRFSYINYFQIPTLCPKMLDINDFYRRGAKLSNQPTIHDRVSVDQFLTLDNTNRFQRLVRPTGVGETTLSKRFIKLSPFNTRITSAVILTVFDL